MDRKMIKLAEKVGPKSLAHLLHGKFELILKNPAFWTVFCLQRATRCMGAPFVCTDEVAKAQGSP